MDMDLGEKMPEGRDTGGVMEDNNNSNPVTPDEDNNNPNRKSPAANKKKSRTTKKDTTTEKQTNTTERDLLDDEQEEEEEGNRFAFQWISVVVRGTMSLYLQKIIEIPNLSELGAKQLTTDMGKANILSIYHQSISRIVSIFMFYLLFISFESTCEPNNISSC